MDNNLRDLYDTFLDSGELETIMPGSTGIWEKDKTLFQSIYKNLDESLLDLEIDEDEDGGYWDASYREFLPEDNN